MARVRTDSEQVPTNVQAGHIGPPPTQRMENPMSIKTKIATLAIAALAVTGSIAATTQSAYAGPKINPVAAGVLGAVVVGSAVAAATQPQYPYGYAPMRRCYWKPHFNMFGQYDGQIRVCPMYY